MTEVSREEAGRLPEGCGVYFMKDEKGRILYIGKALNLRRRVASYFSGRRPGHSRRIRYLIGHIRKIAYVEARSEIEALLLEASLIRDHKPYYNTELKDDKSFPMLKLTMGHVFPRLVVTRDRRDKKAFYYGPYTDVRTLRRAVSYLKRIFPIRSCRTLPKKVCLEYHLRQCVGPCEFPEASDEHRRMVRELDLFLRGQTKEVVRQLRIRMKMISARLEFEEAARLRDRLQALEDMMGQTRALDAGGALEELRIHLGLREVPGRIYGFDISNIQGHAAVGSRVSFVDGVPDKAHYRRFRIQRVEGIDDYAMIQECVARSFTARSGTDPAPDLILIDGGLGQLNAARTTLIHQHKGGVPLISLAKREEEIYRWNVSKPLRLPRRSKALRLLQRVRDEAHRFAVQYHQHLRKRYMVASELDAIRGVGPALKKRLLKKFGTLDAIRRVNLQELSSVTGVSPALAEVLHDALSIE